MDNILDCLWWGPMWEIKGRVKIDPKEDEILEYYGLKGVLTNGH